MRDTIKVEIERFWYKVKKGPGCWEWQAGKTNGGYGSQLFRGKANQAHRISWTLHYGEIPYDKCVLHVCDNRACVRPSHLFLGTRSDNNQDRHTKGRSKGGSQPGECNPMAKLTCANVDRIRNLYGTGCFTQRELGWWFGVARNTISRAVSGRYW